MLCCLRLIESMLVMHTSTFTAHTPPWPYTHNYVFNVQSNSDLVWRPPCPSHAIHVKTSFFLPFTLLESREAALDPALSGGRSQLKAADWGSDRWGQDSERSAEHDKSNTCFPSALNLRRHGVPEVA